jgi:hypothetical protein
MKDDKYSGGGGRKGGPRGSEEGQVFCLFSAEWRVAFFK